MKIASWNVRGFNKLLKQKNAQGMIKNILSIFGLYEVKIKEQIIDRIMETKFSGMSFIHNFHLCDKSRILVMWNNSMVKVDLIFMTDQVIHVNVVCLGSQRVFIASFIYGLHSVVDRRPLWSGLKSFGENINIALDFIGRF